MLNQVEVRPEVGKQSVSSRINDAKVTPPSPFNQWFRVSFSCHNLNSIHFISNGVYLRAEGIYQFGNTK